MAVDYLSKHLSTEGDLKGWDQYQDGSTIGVLSTAQGLLCHVYAGNNGNVVGEAALTLERLQNPDGGWQVRRALIGEQSEISITESTCYCLWALQAAGRADLSGPTQRAVEWLERTQGAAGGWRSSPRVAETQVGPTAAAVTVLARYRRARAAARGADWLRGLQCPDGGWGPTTPPSPLGRDFTSPAYTAHVIIALLASGVSASDPVIERGCKYLEETFDGSRAEPWRSTSFNTLVDPNTSARLEFRHFATPWAIVALAMAGRGLRTQWCSAE
jgi:squalene cyclase